MARSNPRKESKMKRNVVITLELDTETCYTSNVKMFATDDNNDMHLIKDREFKDSVNNTTELIGMGLGDLFDIEW